MIQYPSRNRRMPTDAARAAAVVARRLKMLISVDIGAPEVFAVRLSSIPTSYTWEIRRFGSIVLNRGDSFYPTPTAAREAGLRSLARDVG